MSSDLETLKAKLAETGFIANQEIAVALDLAMKLGRPLLLEGAAGVALAGALTRRGEYSGARVGVVLCGRVRAGFGLGQRVACLDRGGFAARREFPRTSQCGLPPCRRLRPVA